MVNCYRKKKSVMLIYNTLVKPIIKFVSQIWKHMYKKNITRIESVQTRFYSYLIQI